MNQDSVSALPISHLKCFQKHALAHCLTVIQDHLLPASRHVVSRVKTDELALHHPPAEAFIDPGQCVVFW